MALSNIGREPRREITESVLGGLVTLAPFTLVTRWLYLRWVDSDIWQTGEIDKDGNHLINSPFTLEGCARACAHVRTYVNFEVLAAAIGGAIIICAGLWLILYFTHNVGDLICDMLDDAGIHLRPRERR